MYRQVYRTTILTNTMHPGPLPPAVIVNNQLDIIHNSTPPYKGAAALRRTNTSKRIPMKSQNHQPIVPAPTNGLYFNDSSTGAAAT